MVLVYSALFIFAFISQSYANGIQEAFMARNYSSVARNYLKNPKGNYSHKDLAVISYSLRKESKFREDIKLIHTKIKHDFKNEHVKIMRSIKNSESLDPDEVPESLKIYYWNIFNDYAAILRSYPEKSEKLNKDHRNFQAYLKILNQIEFREGKVDKIADDVEAHLVLMEKKIYRFKVALSIQYVSWQQTALLIGAGDEASLITTNRGVCPGGELGMENSQYHFFLNACFLYGSGEVNNYENSAVNYRQSNLPAYGFKGGPGASVIISSSGSRIGVRVPIIYSVQDLKAPAEPGYKIEGNSELNFLVTLYSRWHIDKMFIETEFGKYIQMDEVFWGIGLGRTF